MTDAEIANLTAPEPKPKCQHSYLDDGDMWYCNKDAVAFGLCADHAPGESKPAEARR